MRGLGELEAAVMDVLWRADGPLRGRAVLDRLNTGKSLAYTTVMTVLDNLRRQQITPTHNQSRMCRKISNPFPHKG